MFEQIKYLSAYFQAHDSQKDVPHSMSKVLFGVKQRLLDNVSANTSKRPQCVISRLDNQKDVPHTNMSEVLFGVKQRFTG